MKKSELKTIIKECVKETLFEEGVLSEIIAEVAFGITRAQTLMSEQVQTPKSEPNTHIENKERSKQAIQDQKTKLLETKNKILAAIGGGERMSNIFEGTEPLATAGNPNQQQQSTSPLSGRAPNDSGVDISELFKVAGQKWNHLK